MSTYTQQNPKKPFKDYIFEIGFTFPRTDKYMLFLRRACMAQPYTNDLY